LVSVPCVICEIGIEKFAALSWRKRCKFRDEVLEDYMDVRNHTFHCHQHKRVFHELVGSEFDWSCCVLLKPPSMVEKIAPSSLKRIK